MRMEEGEGRGRRSERGTCSVIPIAHISYRTHTHVALTLPKGGARGRGLRASGRGLSWMLSSFG